MIATGYSMAEVVELMGSEIPTDPDQLNAFAVLAIRVLKAHDEQRFRAAFDLQLAPDALVDAWQQLGRANTLRMRAGISDQPKEEGT